MMRFVRRLPSLGSAPMFYCRGTCRFATLAYVFTRVARRLFVQACSMIFAPETIHEHDQSGIFHEDGGGGHRVKMGPLKIALQARHQLELFCTQPLVVDFMSRKFSSLPPVGATEAEMKDAEEVRRQRRDRLSVQEHPEGNVLEWSREMLSLAAGPHPTFGSLTVLPGAQFIIAELVARPAFCYSIPAIRMAMYLMAYVAMLAVFGFEVLAGHGTVEAGEVIFFIYVLVRLPIGGSDNAN